MELNVDNHTLAQDHIFTVGGDSLEGSWSHANDAHHIRLFFITTKKKARVLRFLLSVNLSNLLKAINFLNCVYFNLIPLCTVCMKRRNLGLSDCLLCFFFFFKVDKHIRRLDTDLARFEADLKEKQIESTDYDSTSSKGNKSKR